MASAGARSWATCCSAKATALRLLRRARGPGRRRRRYGQPDERLIAVHGPRRFLGELSLLTGQPAFFTAVVREPGEVLAVAASALRELVAEDPALGDLILRAFFVRRELLIGIGAGLRIIGSRYSPDTRRLREFAARNRLPHRWIDLEQRRRRRGAAARARRHAGRDAGRDLARQGAAQPVQRRARARGRAGKPRAASATVCDLLVVGAGPGGAGRGRLRRVGGACDTVALDAVAAGGQAGTSSRIENYLGFPSGISGAELAERATIQARKFGARIAVPGEAVALERRDGQCARRLDDGDDDGRRRAVLIATGARYRKLAVAAARAVRGRRASTTPRR